MHYATTVSAQTPSVADAPAPTTDYSDRIILSGWDVTEYDAVVEKIMEAVTLKDYDQLTEQCEQLLDMLYADEKLMAVDAIDTYDYTEDDSRWEEYNARLMYEKVADRLAYHDGMLKKETDDLKASRYYIYRDIRSISEDIEVDIDGNLTHTVLYQYAEEGSRGKKELDYSIEIVLGGMISGITNYHYDNR